jgi:hypothetical protein
MNAYDYQIVQASEKDVFEADVERFIEDGWQPLGGVDVLEMSEGQILFTQAMTRSQDYQAVERLFAKAQQEVVKNEHST